MKIISWNINGLRAVCKNNFLDWFKKANADIVCLQEIRIKQDQLPVDLLNLKNYHCFFNSALKPGYAGTAVFSKKKPNKIKKAIGLKEFDQEGRIFSLEYPDFTLINLYLPHGGRKKENLKYKLDCYDFLLNYLNKQKNKNLILVGDFNIAHQEIDLARPKNNKNNIMFTFEERARIDELIEIGFIDSFRIFNKETNHFTWWPYYRNARQRNIGWRIDYIFTFKNLISRVKKAFILKEITGSDHCPIGIEL